MIPEQVCLSRRTKLASTSTSTTSEILSGPLVLIGAASDLRVTVKVYRTSLEHFAVVCPDKMAANPIGYVNLKNCSVERSTASRSKNHPGRTFHVVRKSCDDGSVLTFRAESSADVHRWLEALDGRFFVKRNSDEFHLNVSLPILLEEGDEE